MRILTNHCDENMSDKEAKWSYVWEALSRLPDKPIREWLLDAGSMTKRLRRASSELKVKVVHQQWQRPTLSEAQFMGISPNSRVLARQVLLCCDGEPWVFGHSVLPKESISGYLRKFQALLDMRPLGELLFREPSLRRSGFQVSQLQPSQKEFQWATKYHKLEAEKLWSRRSLFHVRQKPILVSETFFPAVFAPTDKITD